MHRKTNKDHLEEILSIMQFNKETPSSNYKTTYKFDDEFKTDVKEHDFGHHFKRDFHTVYNEAYIKYKPHMRKWGEIFANEYIYYQLFSYKNVNSHTFMIQS